MDCTDKNLILAMTYHFFYNLAIHIFLINPVDNYGNIVPYILLVILELVTLWIIRIINLFLVKRKKVI